MNGFLWAGAWGIANIVLTVILRLFGLERAVSFWHAAQSLLYRGAVLGFIAGTVFSMTLGVLFRRRELEKTPVLPFSLVGAAVAAGFVGGLLYSPLVLGGSAVPHVELVIDLVGAALLGGATSFGMIKLARAATEPGPDAEPFD